MRKKESIIQNIKTGELFTRYINYDKGFAYVSNFGSPDNKPYKGIKYYLSDLTIQDSNKKFNPKEWRKYKVNLREKAMPKARQIAGVLGLRIAKSSEETNQRGGYDNGDNAIEVTIWGEINLVCTCGNCGDGSRVTLNDMKL